ncbi:MAG: nickel/cobalt transporter [Parvibaculaceae bacterium]
MRSPFALLFVVMALMTAPMLHPDNAFAAAPSPFAMPGQPASSPPPQTAPQTTATAPDANADRSYTPIDYFNALAFRAMRMQQEYFRALATAFHRLDLEKSWSAGFTLISISFAYGIFHAVGPGHGKFIVSSYLLADERDIKRGVSLAFMSSFAQSITAIVMVGALAALLGLTHRVVADAVPLIERVSFVFVTGVGAMLLWRALRPTHAHDEHHDDHHDHDHAHHDHNHGHEHDHTPVTAHIHGSHAHMPAPAELRKVENWREMAGIILAVGLRPCTGAILVLLFALTQGAFAIGAFSSFAMSLGTAITVSTLAVLTVLSKNLALRIAGTADNRWTNRLERGLKIASGLFIMAMGVFLLAGSFLLPPLPLI